MIVKISVSCGLESCAHVTESDLQGVPITQRNRAAGEVFREFYKLASEQEEMTTPTPFPTYPVQGSSFILERRAKGYSIMLAT